MKESQRIEWTVSNRTILRIIGIGIITFMAVRFFMNVSNVLRLISIAVFLSLALNPAVSFIVRKLKLKSRVVATGIAYLIVIVIIGSLISLIVPPIIRQTVNFVNEAPETISSLTDQNTSSGRFIKKYKLEQQVQGISASIQERTSNLRQPVISTAGKVGNTIIATLTVLVITFMLLVEGPYWLDKSWALFPAKNRQSYRRISSKMYRVVSGYVNGQLLLAIIGAAADCIALVIASSVLGVSINAVALAGILVFTGLIPMIGHVIGGIIVVTACLFVSVPLAIFMAIFMFMYQQIENITLQPIIQAKFNELTPLLVFIAALLGIAVGGLFGGLVAIPIAGCARIVYQEFIEKRNGIATD